MPAKTWDFWIDRGGTFTDIIGRDPDGALHARKLLVGEPGGLSRRGDPGHSRPARPEAGDAIPTGAVGEIKMGTTVATNALLERKGDRVAAAHHQGFRDALRIAYQARPDIFAKEIILPEQLYERVVEVEERVRADGTVEKLLDIEARAAGDRPRARKDGYRRRRHRLHARVEIPRARDRPWRRSAARPASRRSPPATEVSPLVKLVGRGDTDGGRCPICRRSCRAMSSQVAGELGRFARR